VVHLDLVEDGRWWPLHKIIGLLQRESFRTHRGFDVVVAEYARDCAHHRRTDLHLLTLLSPLPFLQCGAMRAPSNKLVDDIVQHLKDDDLTLSLLRVLAVSSRPRLIRYLRNADAPKMQELLTQLDRTGSRLKNGSPQDDDLGSVCLANVQLSLRLVDPDANAKAKVRLTDLVAMLGDIERIGKHARVVNQTLALNADGALQYKVTKASPSWSFVVYPVQHTLAVLCAAHGILSHFLADYLFVDNEYSATMISEILIRARDAQRVCWRTFRYLNKDLASLERDFDEDHQFARLEGSALAQLAQFERICRCHAVAVPLAVGALKQFRNVGFVREEGNLLRSLSVYLENQGVTVPEIYQLHTDRSSSVRDAPCLALRAACHDKTIAKAVAVLQANGIEPGGWGIHTSMFVKDFISNPEVRAAAFTIAVHMGAAPEARHFFHLSKRGKKPENAEMIKDTRTALAKFLGATGMMAWADAIAAVSQSAVPWLDKTAYNSVRSGVRKLLRELVQFDPPISAMESLFLSHVQVGLGYHAKTVHQSRYANVGAMTDIATTDIIDRMVVATDRCLLQAVTVEHFRAAAFGIHEDEIMVSLMSYDGGSLQVTLLAAQEYWHGRPSYGVNDQDWPELCRKFSLTISSRIYDYVEHPEFAVFPNFEIPKPFLELCRGVLVSALTLNPNARRIMIHAENMWNIVPWQFIMQQHLEDEVGLLLEDLIRSGRRRETRREFGKIVFWRVPGVQLGRHEVGSRLPERTISIQTGDTTFSDIQKRLQENRTQPGAGLLSILAHGATGGERVSFSVNGKRVSSFQLTQYGEFRLVIMHVCHGSAVSKLNKGDDISSAPSKLVQGGAWVVIAPGLPMPTEQIEKLEQCFYDLPFVSDDLTDIEQRYLCACIGSPATALYTLFSGAIAPRLGKLTA